MNLFTTKFLLFPVTFFLLRPNTFISALFSNAVNLFITYLYQQMHGISLKITVRLCSSHTARLQRVTSL
jgi:hypothetical protein